MSARTILNPPISLSSGNAEIDVSEVTLNSITGDTSYAINSYSDVIAITAGSATTIPTIQLTNSVDTVQISCPSTGVLEIGNQLRINESGSTNYVNVNCTGLGEANVESLLIGTTAPATNVLLQCTSINELSVPNLSASGSVTVGPNVVGGVNYSYVNSPQFGGGIYGFKSNTPLTVPNGSSASYNITIPFSPFTGFSLGDCVVTVNWFCDYPINYTGYGITDLGNGQLQLNFAFASSVAAFPVIVSGINGMIFYQG